MEKKKPKKSEQRISLNNILFGTHTRHGCFHLARG